MTKEAMKLALDALQKIYIAPEHEEYIRVWWPACEQAITALREALAEQPACEHEWLRGGCLKCGQSIEQPAQQWQSTADKCELEKVPANGSLLPPQRTWVGLTDEEVMVAAYQAGFDIHEDYENEDDPEAMHWWTPDGEACDDSLLKLRDLIEAKLKEKNT